MKNEKPDNLPGDSMIANFRIGKQFGVGGMGEVFRLKIKSALAFGQ